VTSQGETRVVETSAAAMARSTQTLRLRSQRDYAIPPRIAPKGAQNTLMMRAAADAAVKQAAASSSPVTIDVMVAYSRGFANMLGSQRLALIRIQNLVDITNQAYVASGVNQRIRLVYTTQVHYPDNTSNQSALDDITGIDENGNPVSVPASLANIASLRTQHGADLVALMRSYDHSTQGDCGVGWLIGGDQTAIVPSESSAYGYSVVSDGDSGGYYCLDTTFAHELGHNMGDAHDRANATAPGAYSYSYGYVGNGPNGFSTIMAYGTDTQTPLAVFSNPNILSCQNTPCGVADSSSSAADNAHSMNNTAALVAAFEATTVGTPPPFPGLYAHNDVNGDGSSDLLLEFGQNARFGYWILRGQKLVRTWSIATSSAYRIVATGDFNGDGYMDIVWSEASNSLRMWLGGAGESFSMGHPIGNLPAGSRVVGAADVDGDGKSDLLIENQDNTKFTYWIMNGSYVARQWSVVTNPAYKLVATGDFNGDGFLDIAWTSSQRDVRLWFGNGISFAMGNPVGTYAPGWRIVDVADVNGDGKTDLLLQYGNNERFGYWILDGKKLVRTWSVATSLAYKFVGTGDFNGDGTLDIAWTSSARDVRLWFGQKGSFSMGHPVGNYSSGWQPVVDVPNSTTW
jgi:hypothetical protein